MSRVEKKNKNQKGFTLMEVIVSVGIFVILISAVVQIYVLIVEQISSYREQTEISSLANQYIEIARNLPYSAVGTLNGNPYGELADLPNALSVNLGGNDYKIYYAISYVDDPADGTILAGTDPAPNDYKQIKLYIENVKKNVTSNFLTNVSPKGLEGMASGGALYISVINAVGEAVPGATINIVNTAVTPNINLTRTSDATGHWIEVALPVSANNYHIVVTKTGYSQDQTYPSSTNNPNPVKPDSTIVNGQVTSVSFSIDQASSLNFKTLNQICGPISGASLKVSGAKLIGVLPDVLKFDNTYTSDSSGSVNLSNIEWDTYIPTISSSNYMVYGSFPIGQVSLLPSTSQNFMLILGTATPRSFLAILKDTSTGNAIEGVNINLHSSSLGYDSTKITGGSIWGQQSWSGGSGQINFSDDTKYFEDDGSINATGVPSGLRLLKMGSNYVSSGTLVSSTYDTGTDQTTYTTLTWQPTSQDASTLIKFQIATNNDNETWNFAGPDGTEQSFYTVPGTSINQANNNSRYVRYKVFLSTTDPIKTPVLTSINVNYVSGCYTPGQVIFTDLEYATDYYVTASVEGYKTQTIRNMTINGYGVLPISLEAGSGVMPNNAPYFIADPSDSGSSLSAPTLAGANVSFASTALDKEGDKYYMAVCKTNSITAHANSAPTCDGGSWCVSGQTNSGYQASCDYTAQNVDAGNQNWYIFACDYNDSSVCSSVFQGSGNNGSPFYVLPTWLNGWTYRKKITISKTNVASSLSNFPLYIKIAETGGGATNIGAHALSSGYDIRFTLADKTTLIPYERESFSVTNNNATADFWVKVPTISNTADTEIYIYYGNSSANTDYTSTGSPTIAKQVWDANYKGVWHLKETQSAVTGNYKDSTLTGANSTNTTNLPTQTAGKIGYGQTFNNNNSTKIITSSIAHNITTGNFTFEAWVSPAINSGDRAIMSNGAYSPKLFLKSGTKLEARWNNDLDSGDTLIVGSWQHTVLTRSGTNILNFYKNGSMTSKNPTSSSTLGSSGVMAIGFEGSSINYFSGGIDEVRLSDIARPTNWVKFEYCNMMSSVSGTCAGNNETTFASQETSQ